MNPLIDESTRPAKKADSTVVTVLCAFALAGALIAIGCSFVPILGRLAVAFSLPSLLLTMVATAIAWLRRTRLFLPALTLLVTAVPAAKENHHLSQVVWVQSDEICRDTGLVGASLIGLIATAAVHVDHTEAVGSQTCSKLGKRFTDHECNGEPVGRVKCEP